MTDAEIACIKTIEAYIKDFPNCESYKEWKRFSNWLSNKTFPIKFELDTPGYFHEDRKAYNRLYAELICNGIDVDLDYDNDYFHVTIEQEDQIKIS